ncbi:retrovirus-related Pol polyprotein from transposon RE1 [Trichonephila clavipes]|nr:retrovirus-related Pol polyprotein from transposon RE1 [Trichonephila clavipes]
MNSVASTLNRVTDMEFNNQISVLTQHNWNTWKHDMQVLLMHYGCWQFIMQTKLEQPDEEATYKEKLDLQLSKDRCYTLIYTNISSDLKNLITEKTDGVAAWKILKDHFEPVTKARIIQLLDHFFGTKYQPGEDVGIFISRVKTAATRLQEAGHKLDDLYIGFQLIRWLPREFQSTVQQIYRWKEEDFRVVKIEAELILEANRLQLMKQDLEKAENAYLSSFTSKKSKTLPGATAAAHGDPNGKNDYQKKGGKVFNCKTIKNVKQSIKTIGPCYVCNKYGHLKVNCKEKKFLQKSPSTVNETFNTEFNINLRFCEAECSLLELDKQLVTSCILFEENSDKGVWVIDTAATSHYCNDKSLFLDLKPITNMKMLLATEDKSCPVEGIGTLRFRVKYKESFHEITLSDVLFNPKLRRNLLSGSRLESKGAHFVGTKVSKTSTETPSASEKTDVSSDNHSLIPCTEVKWIRNIGRKVTGSNVYYSIEGEATRLKSFNEIERYYLSEQQEVLMVEVTIPNCYKQVIRSRDASKWHDAMDKEINVMMERKVWDLVDHPDNIKILENRWVYTNKYDENNKIIRYKARLVARGNTQLRGETFDEVFSPVVNFTIVRLFFTICVCLWKWTHIQVDITNAYLYANLDTVIYMKQPTGYEIDNNKVYGMITFGKEMENVNFVLQLLQKNFDLKIMGKTKKLLAIEFEELDSDFATNRDDRVSMGGFITFIDETPISWRTFKQKSVSLSTMEAEYVSLTEAAKGIHLVKECASAPLRGADVELGLLVELGLELMARQPRVYDQDPLGYCGLNCTYALVRRIKVEDDFVFSATPTAVLLDLGPNPTEYMDVCKCIVPSQDGCTLNSRRDASPPVRLGKGQERWEVDDHPQDVIPLN